MLKPVITVHGIWTEGLWQEEIAPVLYPHFEPVSRKYRSYRWLGPIDFVFAPIVLLLGFIPWLAGVLYSWWHNWLFVWIGASWWVPVVIPVVAHVVAHIRLGRTIEKFLHDTAPEILKGHAHVIAHSLARSPFGADGLGGGWTILSIRDSSRVCCSTRSGARISVA